MVPTTELDVAAPDRAAHAPAIVTDAASSNDALLSRRYRALTLGMVALVALCAFESMAVATAMPSVAQALDGLSLYALSFAATLAASVIGLVLAGHWSDRRGPILPLWVGTAWFVAGLLLAGLAPDMRWLLAGRIVQGVGTGAIGVALHVVVGRTFPVALRPRVFAAFSAAWVVPSLIGPLIAGLIVAHLGWRWVFLLVPPLALPAILVLRSGLDPMPALDRDTPVAHRHPADTGRIGWAVLAATSAGLLHLSSQVSGASGITLFVVALTGLTSAAPRLLPRGSLRARRGLPSVIALRAIASATFFGAEVFIPLLLSFEYGLSPLWAGAVLMIGSLGWSGGSWYQGHTHRQWSRTQVLQTGMSLMAAGIFLLGSVLALLMVDSPSWASHAVVVVAVISWTMSGLGMGLVSPSLSVLTLALSPTDEQGRNSSALQLADALGTASVLSVAGWLFTLLSQRTPTAAYLSVFGITCALALLGLAFSSRTEPN